MVTSKKMCNTILYIYIYIYIYGSIKIKRLCFQNNINKFAIIRKIYSKKHSIDEIQRAGAEKKSDLFYVGILFRTCSHRRLPKHKFIEAIIVHVKSKYQFMMVTEKKR
jgi:hypothetical protein